VKEVTRNTVSLPQALSLKSFGKGKRTHAEWACRGLGRVATDPEKKKLKLHVTIFSTTACRTFAFD